MNQLNKQVKIESKKAIIEVKRKIEIEEKCEKILKVLKYPK